MANRILIIDDEPDVAIVMAYRLEHNGYEVDVANDTKTAFEKLHAREYGLVILDFYLPDMTAVEVSTQIRQLEMNSKVPIILTSASIDVIEQRAKDCTAATYLPKPIEAEDLISTVKKFI